MAWFHTIKALVGSQLTCLMSFSAWTKVAQTSNVAGVGGIGVGNRKMTLMKTIRKAVASKKTGGALAASDAPSEPLFTAAAATNAADPAATAGREGGGEAEEDGGRGVGPPAKGVYALVPPDSGQGGGAPQSMAQYLNRTHLTPLVRCCFLDRDVRDETLDIILNAAEKTPWDGESIAAAIKTQLDSRLSPTWHVIAGECYGFELDYDADGLIYVFYGSLAILAWKCGTVLVGRDSGGGGPLR